MSERPPRRNPIAFGVGVGLTAFGAVVLVAGEGSAAGVVVLLVGVALMCAGLVQKSIEKSRT